MGSAQRPANGNTFICESAFGRLFEVTPQGETVWEYIIPYFNTYRNTSARALSPVCRTALSARTAMLPMRCRG